MKELNKTRELNLISISCLMYVLALIDKWTQYYTDNALKMFLRVFLIVQSSESKM